MSDVPYQTIAEHYASCFAKYGAHHRGLDWPNEKDVFLRNEVMLSGIPSDCESKILDVGCGLGYLFEHIQETGRQQILYTGIDINVEFVEHCRKNYPNVTFIHRDLLKSESNLEPYDHVIINGVFTVKQNLSFEQMWAFVKTMLLTIWPSVRQSLRFNVMSTHVEWEKENLFHLPLDTLADFLSSELTRRFMVLNNYGLYEYTTIVQR